MDGFFSLAAWLIVNISPFFIIYFAIINFAHTVFLFIGSIKVFYRKYSLFLEQSQIDSKFETLPKFSFIIPSFNEEKKIEEKIKNTLALENPEKEVIIVDDGSVDKTFFILNQILDLVAIPKLYEDQLSTKPVKAVYQSKKHPNFFVIQKENGKKFDAVNAGLNLATGDFVLITDVDTLLDQKEFQNVLRRILTDPDTIAIGASVRVKNGIFFRSNQALFTKFPDSFLIGVQAIEYLRSFFIRMGIDWINDSFIISGCFSIFPRKVLLEVEGFAPTVAEDMEIIIRLQRFFRKKNHRFKIFYIPDPVAWTEVPQSLKKLAKQRANWHKGLMESFFFHKSILFNPFYKSIGLAAYPFGLFFEILEPVVELLGFFTIIGGYFLGLLNIDYVLLLMAFSFGFTFFISISSLFIEELSFDKFPRFKTTIGLLLISAVENLGYRQLNLIWRLKGIFDFFKELPLLIPISKKINLILKKPKKSFSFLKNKERLKR
jgi:cellulose synthase/poly-beta-1,6-N-acetylglucosamine synthase-like glycosyltransferase